MRKLFLITLFILFATNVSFANEIQKNNGGDIEKTYLVKGMYCGGCVFAVKKALERVGIKKENIVNVTEEKPDPKNKIGMAIIKFPYGTYHGLESDCKIIKEIKDNPGYIAYIDKNNTDLCGINK